MLICANTIAFLTYDAYVILCKPRKGITLKKLEKLSRFLNNYGINLTPKQEEQFNKYFEMLVETNKKMNLTAITEFEEVEEKHFMDSLAIVSFFDMTKVDSLIDVGTGAGFPGMPLKIMFPHLKVVLADSLNKRVGFLNEVIESLRLTDVIAVHGRAEELARDENYREQFDICVSRAVSPLPSLSELCMPFVKVGGYFVPYKTKNADDEINESQKAITRFGGKLTEKKELVFGESELHRCFPVIEKVSGTPSQYPRKNGTPQKKPIL